MNTQAGKSIGIALLLAAGLLAALFATGVFAPTGAGAAIKGGSKAPEVKLSNNAPSATGVTMTITFEPNAGIEVTGDDPITIDIPVAGTAAADMFGVPSDFAGTPDTPSPYVRVTQQGVGNVGGVTVLLAAASTISIGLPDADSGRENLERDKRVTVRITGLANPTGSFSAPIGIAQGDDDYDADLVAGGQQDVMLPVFTPMTGVSVGVSPTGVGESGATLTFKFTSPGGTDNVVITLPDSTNYSGFITATGSDHDDNFVMNPPAGTGNGQVDYDFVNNTASDEGDTITIPGAAITAKQEFVLTIGPSKDTDDQTAGDQPGTGFVNPTNSVPVSFMFRDGTVAPAITRTLYFTSRSEIGLKDPEGMPGVDISSIDAGAEDVSLSFNFKPVIAGDADPPIKIELNPGFVMGTDGEVTLKQIDGTNSVDVYGEVTYDEDERNNILITLGETTDTDETPEAERRETSDTVSGNIHVVITDLINPTLIGRDITLVTVTQGDHAEASVEVRMTGTELSTTVAGDPVRIKISTEATSEIPAGDDIVVTLKNFTLPATIAENQVIIDGGDVDDDVSTPDKDQRYYGIPSAVSVSGDKVTLSIPASYPDGSQVENGIPSGNIYTITFKLGAGIKNPTVKLADRTPTASGETTAADSTEVTSKVSAKNAVTPSRKANASRGDLVDFSVVGLRTGSATLYLMKGYCVDARQDSDGCVDHTGAEVLDADGDPRPANEDDDFRIGGDLQTDGRVTVQRRVTSSLFAANEGGNGPRELVGTTLVGTNIIYSVDGTGTPSDAIGRLAIEPTVDLGTQSLKQGGLLELDISDWHYGTITGIHVGGVPVVHSWRGGGPVTWTPEGVSGGEADFIVVMPPGVRLGEQQLKLTGTTTDEQDPRGAGNEDSFATKIVVDPLDLEITPVNSDGIPEVVINQEFTIEGRGFNTESGACIQSVKFGDVTFEETTAGVDVDCSSDGLRPDTAGNFSATFRLDPDLARVRSLKIGEYRVEVKDNEERVGVVDVLIPEPVVEVTPDTSRRGTTVTVVGSKFPASSELAVEIKYGLAGNERTITAATPDSVGSWRETFVIPTTAVIGEDHVVKAAPIDTDYDHFEGKGSHRLPEQEVIVTPSRVAAGGRMRVEGHNMPLFTLVHLKISNITVSGDGFETDGIGSFVKTGVLVPQLQPGIHTVEALVETQGDRAVSVRTSVEVADIVTRPSAEAFDDLISAASLTRVWHLDAATQTWSFFDPAPEFADFNTLTEVSSGQIVTIIMSAPDEFQGRALYVGSNNVAIE